MDTIDVVLAVAIFAIAVLYSSVGHAGASGYLAVMALAGLAPATMKPAALTLNIFVAVIAAFRFWRSGAFSWQLLWPFAITSIPSAYLGGVLVLPGHAYKQVLGLVLIYSAWYSFGFAGALGADLRKPPHLVWLLCIGVVLGLFSGLTGVGGGIFLSPLLLFLRLAEIRVISGVAAVFILVNSIAGLLGVITTGAALPKALPWWILAAMVGGNIGALYGSKYLNSSTLRQLLAVVLAIAGIKMLLV